MNGETTWSFRAGEWYGVFGPRTVAVLPPSERPRVAALWELVDDGAGFDEVLDALLAGGLSRLPGFVLLSDSVGLTRVLVRGPARVFLTTDVETVEVEGDATTAWVERSVLDVRSVRIEVGAEGAGAEAAVGGSIRFGLVRLAAAELAATAAPQPVAPPEGPPTAAVDLSQGYDHQDDHDGLTRHPSTPVAQPLAVPDPLTPPPPPVVAQPVARLLLPDGTTVDVDRSVLIGRAPEAGRIVTEGEPRLVAVDSPRQEVSSTHVEIRPGAGADLGAAVVTDLGSTNGTVVVQPGLPPQDLRPGVTVQLVPGALVDLGDGVSIQVLDA